MRVALAALLLGASLILVAWRQSRALEALAALEDVRSARALAEAERDEMEGRIEVLGSRGRVVPEARSRLGMHLPDVSEIRFLAGEELR